MKYPEFWRKFICVLAFISGCLVLLIAGMSVLEAVLRRVFNSPTSWNLNTCCCLLIYVVFLGSPYAFQEHGHVAVDLLRDVVDKAGLKRIPRRIMSIAGYLMAFSYICVLLYSGWKLTAKAVAQGTLTTTTFPIPIASLYVAIIIGSVLMLVTLLFIILDLFAKGNKYM